MTLLVIKGMLDFSLPEIGEYRVPTIFVNKKSNFSIKNRNNSITTLLFFFESFGTILLLRKKPEVEIRKFYFETNFMKTYFFAFSGTNSL